MVVHSMRVELPWWSKSPVKYQLRYIPAQMVFLKGYGPRVCRRKVCNWKRPGSIHFDAGL